MAFIKNMNMNKIFSSAPDIRPCYNIGSFFDILSGTLVQGLWGNVFINGGLWSTDAIVGPNNSFKSTLSKHKLLACMNNYPYSTAITYDTEISGTGGSRYNELAVAFPHLKDYDFNEIGEEARWMLNTSADISGEKWWADVKEYCNFKSDKKTRDSVMLTTPFKDTRSDSYLKGFIPTVFELDSLSQFQVSSVTDKFETQELGDKSRNTEFMKSGLVKSQMIREMGTVMAKSGGVCVITAHVGEKIEMDQYNPSMKKFQFQKGNRTVKHVTESFNFLINNLYEVVSAVPLINRNTKLPEFPSKETESLVGDTDLMELTISILRGKGGCTGVTFPLICSQAEGVLEGLSNFWFLKKNNYGISGNNINYSIDLYPECNLSRTTVRDKIENDPKLARALRLQADLYLAKLGHKKSTLLCPEERLCSAKELYDDLKAMGYDWDELLDTISEWKFREDAQEKPTLTIYDLLNMRAGVYKPYWHQEEWKKSKHNAMEP